jgi:CBS domain containing-hemolysin-like protein
VHIKDLFRAAAEGARGDFEPAWPDPGVASSSPRNKPIEQISARFQQRKLQMAIVIDEWGSVEG